MYFFFKLLCFLFVVWFIQLVWRWPNHESRFQFWPREEMILPRVRVRRRIYYWGRYGLRVMEEKIDIWITTQRILFGHAPWITQIIYFQEEPFGRVFRGPSFFCPPSQIQWSQSSIEGYTLKIHFRSLDREAYFEILDLPEQPLSSLFSSRSFF